jgi:amino acid adenylation domain-containing protein
VKTAEILLSELRQLNVKVWAEGDVLRYRAAKGVLTTEMLTQLREQKAEILSFLSQTESSLSSPVEQIKPVTRTSYLPLSSGQQRFWFLEQLETANAANNLARVFRLEGQLDTTVLEQAICSIIARHEILRTNFQVIDGTPVQIISPHISFNITFFDLREKCRDVKFHVSTNQNRPFDLTAEPLLRVILMRLNEETHILQIVMHHIISDDWSVQIFFKELSLFYRGLFTGTHVPLPDLKVQYADYAHWQHQQINQGVIAKQLNYWQQHLADAPSILELPTDRHHNLNHNSNYNSNQTFQAGIVPFSISVDITQKLKKLPGNTTLYITLLTAFATLLSRYSCVEDIVIGTAVANRHPVETESLIGLFVNTLALRIQLQGNPTFTELLARVRQVALNAYAHPDVPFDYLVKTLQPQRHLSYTPLFQVMFVLQNVPKEELEFLGLTTTLMELNKPTAGATFDLTLSLRETESKLQGAFEYNANLFDATTIQRMAQHFQILVEAIANNPEQPIGQLPLLTATEINKLLVEWNNTQTNYPQDKCIHQLFEEQVQKQPNAIAVKVIDKQRGLNQQLTYQATYQQLTYQQLNQKANQIAHYLRKLGVCSDSLVGVCVEDSLTAIIGFLGILKAGGAYLPLDPNYPPERLALILEDAQASILLTQQLLTQEKFVEHLPSSVQHIVCFDIDCETINQQSQENLVSEINSEINLETNINNLAYVIYTSGSTGRPKGVSVIHRSVIRLVVNTNYIDLQPDDVVAQASSISFDAATFEIWGALLNGGKMVILERDTVLSPTDLASSLLTEGITTLFLTTALLNQVIQSEPSAFASLRFLLFGGEAVDVRWVQKLLDEGSPKNLLHVYGPTENTTFSTWYRIEQIEPTAETIPIGRPIANTQTYILDRYLQPTPIGIPGELYTGGAGLAREYLNRPDLTNERFIANPFTEGERLYKTGDLVRYLPDGNIEFLNRIDFQVKIRGFRIELGEIEAALNQHPQVQQTLVIQREDRPGDKYLTAYIVPEVVSKTEALSINELRLFLKQQLPEYMIPTAFVILDVFPLTPNGKIDRRALKVPNLEANRETAFVPPRNPTEEIVASIMATIVGPERVGLERVGINDNFFELGGHSLLATQVISRLQTAFQVELPLRCIFESPTVAQLSEVILTKIELAEVEPAESQKDIGLKIPPILPVDREKNLPSSWAQQRLWFLHQLESESTAYTIPFALKMSGKLNVNALEQALQKIVQRHEVLRTRFHFVSNQLVQVIVPHLTLTLPVVDFQADFTNLPNPWQELEHLALSLAKKPFDLAVDSVIRVALWQLSPEEHVLLVLIHHIAGDAWSLGVFTRELSAHYQAIHNGTSSLLPELSIQYADFAVWQRQWLSEQVIEHHLSYWKQQLASASTLLALPTDRPRPAVQTFRGAREYFLLDENLTQKLKQLSQKSGTTLFMTLLAAFVVLLSRMSNQTDIVIGSPIANRNRQEIEPLIGFFVNTLALRFDLAKVPNFETLLAQVREVTIEAYVHQDLPFEMLVEALQIDRHLDRNPLVQVMFGLQNTPTHPWDLPDLTVEQMPLSLGGVRFDLEMDFAEVALCLKGTCFYSTDLFDAQTIIRIIGYFQTLLTGILENPQQPVTDLPLLNATQVHELLLAGKGENTNYPHYKCIHHLFEEQAQKTPNAIAVEKSGQQISYRELNERANKLAHYLQEVGVEPEVLVGIYVERSIEMIVGCLGILKAGGAYIPLDPVYPQERIAYILQDSQIAVLVTQEKLLPKLVELQAKVISLDTNWEEISNYNISNPVSKVSPTNLAYVIYTSGSTGKPKGVEIAHSSLVNFASVAVQEYDITQQDRVLQFASISFDTAAEEIYPCLITGATLVLRTEDLLSSSNHFWLCCQNWQLTVLDLPTAYWHYLTSDLQISDTRIPSCLRLVIIGGEQALAENLKRWLRSLKDLNNPPKLVNTYGPTEATIVTTVYPFSDSTETLDWSVPIGKPIGNTQLYILDKSLQPVPFGVVGELHIAGACLARGYLNRTDLTQEKFIPNPFSNSTQNTKLYKTGDLVRYRTDGNLEFLGRIDKQVKIRGFRIELGEIEAAIAQHPAVEETAVIVREDTPDRKFLVAYIVSNQSDTLIKSELRGFLKQKLPDYMVPGVFVMLDSLPLTPNGKIDRRALSTLEILHQELTATFVAPQTWQEELLIQIWCEVLHLEKVGINDNFFELGGDSILSIQIISKANQAGLPITTKQIFQYQTIAELAKVANTSETKKAEQKAEQGVISGALPLTPIQHNFFEQNLPSPHHWNQSFLFEVQLLEVQPLDPKKLQQVVQQLLVHHDALRLRFTKSDSGWQQVNALTDENVPICLIDLSTLPPNEQTSAIEAKATELQTTLNLESGPLVRVALFHLGYSKSDRLLLIIHHLAVDGVSWRILLEDLQTAYQQLQNGKPIQLPPKTTSFKHWAEQLAEYAQTDVAKKELTYWRNISSTQIKHLPVDCNKESNTEASARTVLVSLNQEETRALLQEVPKAYRTQINDVLLTALVQTLAA